VLTAASRPLGELAGDALAAVITPASVQDRDAARPLLWNLRRACACVRLAWADAGYQAGKLTAWAAALRITLHIVRKPDAHAFEVVPGARKTGYSGTVPPCPSRCTVPAEAMP
jgi:hypothetical protein